MYNSLIYKAIMAGIIITGCITSISNEVYAADWEAAQRAGRGGRNGRGGLIGMERDAERPELMRQMDMMGRIRAEGLADNLKIQWRTTILAEETTAPEAEEEALGVIEKLQKEQALIRLSLETLKEKSELLEDELFNSPEVAAAFQAATDATEAFYEKLEADPEYAKLKAEHEKATEEINAFREEVQLNRGNRREVFDKWRENAGAIRELEETIQETRRLMTTFTAGNLELQALQNKKTESWNAFEGAFIEILKNNEEYITILDKLEKLKQWADNLQDVIEVERREARQNQRRKAAQPIEVDPEVEAEPRSVF